jgi:hydrogenase maturation protein HypF
VRDLTHTERSLFARMLASGTSCPQTTSVGRLFDGVSALLGLHQRVTFEGQAAMALEFVADRDEHDVYPIELRDGVLDWKPLVAAVVEDRERGVGVPSIAARFHNTLAAGITEVALWIGCPRVALSGGCFQNHLLVGRTVQRLRASGFEPLLHGDVPPNDGGIALGQIHVASTRL